MLLLHILVGWYPDFTFKRSLMRKLYTESNDQNNIFDNPADIKSRVSKFKPFVYDLKEYFLMNLIFIFTCFLRCRCCKTKKVQEKIDRY